MIRSVWLLPHRHTHMSKELLLVSWEWNCSAMYDCSMFTLFFFHHWSNDQCTLHGQCGKNGELHTHSLSVFEHAILTVWKCSGIKIQRKLQHSQDRMHKSDMIMAITCCARLFVHFMMSSLIDRLHNCLLFHPRVTSGGPIVTMPRTKTSTRWTFTRNTKANATKSYLTIFRSVKSLINCEFLPFDNDSIW